jgi:ribosomal peptide maturation radical SAM protein 1
MGFRSKSPDRVIDELRALVDAHDCRLVCLTDNIMPHSYHRSVIPRIAEEVGAIEMFYEQKANLRLDQVKGLWDAGCTVIQPGIESLSTPVLELMRKGVLARQNVALLRYARAVGMGLNWSVLYGFPGDVAADYEAIAELLPKLVHLCPPNGLSPLSIDRFSPYFDDAVSFGITELRPQAAYEHFLPEGADASMVAYHFVGTWQSGSLDAPELLIGIGETVQRWRTLWQQDVSRPMLHIAPGGPGQWVLSDTRGLADGVFYLSDGQAAAALVGGPRARVPQAAWAIRNGFAADLDGWCVPLATASYEVLSAFAPDEVEAGLTVLGARP